VGGKRSNLLWAIFAAKFAVTGPRLTVGSFVNLHMICGGREVLALDLRSGDYVFVSIANLEVSSIGDLFAMV
jgi:hypothetical protein